MNVNTREYWEQRFRTSDWAKKGGKIQSREHALRFSAHLEIPHDFTGSICDFGCAEGDAFPVYREYWPNAKLTGIDFASCAIELACKKYAGIGDFLIGSYLEVPKSDVIISAHTLEHLEHHIEIIRALRERCKFLFVIVPYKEDPIGSEHLRKYDENAYNDLALKKFKVCDGGWQYSGFNLIYQIYLKNLLRPLLGKKIARMPRQIVFAFNGNC